MTEWHIRRNGKEEGPIDSQELKRLAASGQLQPTDEIWREGMADWVPASKTKLFPASPETSSSPAPASKPAASSVSTSPNPLSEPKAKPWLLTKPGLLVSAGGLVVIVFTVTLILLLAGGGGGRGGSEGGTREQQEVAKLREELNQIKLKPGRVSVTVTYQGKGGSGSRADTNAKVFLIERADSKNKKLGPFCVFFVPGLVQEGLAAKGVQAYGAEAGGDGKVTMNRVKPGKYFLYLISGNVTCGSAQERKTNEELLRKHFDDGKDAIRDQAAYYQISIELVTVESGDDVVVSHDFGTSRS